MISNEILLIDVGHTRIKFAQWITQGKIKILSQPLSSPTQVLLASVSPKKEKCLSLQLRSQAKKISTKDIPVPTDYDTEKIGVDRLLAVLTGIKMFPGAKKMVVVDAGSLTTVEFVENGRHRGGVILPSVLEICKLCSEVIGWEIIPVYSENRIWGTDTESAVGAGILALFSPIKEFSPEVILLGGGGSKYLFPIIQVLHPCKLYLEPNLVLLGLSYLVDR